MRFGGGVHVGYIAKVKGCICFESSHVPLTHWGKEGRGSTEAHAAHRSQPPLFAAQNILRTRWPQLRGLLLFYQRCCRKGDNEISDCCMASAACALWLKSQTSWRELVTSHPVGSLILAEQMGTYDVLCSMEDVPMLCAKGRGRVPLALLPPHHAAVTMLLCAID